jgi:hypothetical protein
MCCIGSVENPLLLAVIEGQHQQQLPSLTWQRRYIGSKISRSIGREIERPSRPTAAGGGGHLSLISARGLPQALATAPALSRALSVE